MNFISDKNVYMKHQVNGPYHSPEQKKLYEVIHKKSGRYSKIDKVLKDIKLFSRYSFIKHWDTFEMDNLIVISSNIKHCISRRFI